MSDSLPRIDGVPLDAFMASVMAREVRNGEWVSHGASVPLAGAALFLAIDTHAPDIDVWMQGCVTPSNHSLTDALIAPERLYETSPAHMSQTEIINFSLRGNCDFQFLRPLQIDPRGNVNVSLIERRDKPPLKFHGIAIGDALTAVRRICLYVTEHSPRVFVERLPFRSAAGYDAGEPWRATVGLPEGGPASVVTPLAVLEFSSCRMRVRSLHHGVTLDRVRQATGFAIEAAPDCAETPAPSPAELAALDRVDGEGIRRLEFRETRAAVLRQLAQRTLPTISSSSSNLA